MKEKRKNYILIARPRRVFHLVWDDEDGWVLKNEDGLVEEIASDDESKAKFVSRMRSYVRQYCANFNHLGQLVVHSKTGISFEATYGADPRRSRG